MFYLKSSFVVLVLGFLIWGNVQSETPSEKNTTPCGEACYAGIEIGGKGIKAVVIKRDEDRLPQLVDEDKGDTYEIPAPAADIKAEGRISERTLNAIGQAVSSLSKKVQKRHNIPANQIYIVGSSGVSTAKNKEELKKKVREETGAEMEFISVDVEVCYEFRAASDFCDGAYSGNKKFCNSPALEKSLLIDIGSSNLKGCHKEENLSPVTSLLANEEGQQRAFDLSEYGTVKFSGSVDKLEADTTTSQEFANNAKELWVKEVLPLLNVEVDKKPSLQDRKQVFLTGGIVWAMMTALVPEKVSRTERQLMELHYSDINKIYGRVERNAEKVRNDPTMKKVAKVFSAKNLIAGAQILVGLANWLKFKRKRVFFWNNPTSWLFGYTSDKAWGKDPMEGKEP